MCKDSEKLGEVLAKHVKTPDSIVWDDSDMVVSVTNNAKMLKEIRQEVASNGSTTKVATTKAFDDLAEKMESKWHLGEERPAWVERAQSQVRNMGRYLNQALTKPNQGVPKWLIELGFHKQVAPEGAQAAALAPTDAAATQKAADPNKFDIGYDPDDMQAAWRKLKGKPRSAPEFCAKMQCPPNSTDDDDAVAVWADGMTAKIMQLTCGELRRNQSRTAPRAATATPPIWEGLDGDGAKVELKPVKRNGEEFNLTAWHHVSNPPKCICQLMCVTGLARQFMTEMCKKFASGNLTKVDMEKEKKVWLKKNSVELLKKPAAATQAVKARDSTTVPAAIKTEDKKTEPAKMKAEENNTKGAAPATCSSEAAKCPEAADSGEKKGEDDEHNEEDESSCSSYSSTSDESQEQPMKRLKPTPKAKAKRTWIASGKKARAATKKAAKTGKTTSKNAPSSAKRTAKSATKSKIPPLPSIEDNLFG